MNSKTEAGAGVGKFHAIGVTTRGYYYLATLGASTIRDAAREVRKHHKSHRVTVLRDGSTGKRYSMRECESIATGAQP